MKTRPGRSLNPTSANYSRRILMRVTGMSGPRSHAARTVASAEHSPVPLSTVRVCLSPKALLLILMLAIGSQCAAEFDVEAVHTRIEGDMLVIDAKIDYALSERALEALDNGVPLTLVVHMQLRRNKDWVWNDSLVDQRLRYVIRYKPLSERYLVSRLPGDGGISYVTRDAAIAALGEIEGLQLVSRERLRKEKGPFELQIKASLDIEELPVPLRPIAYLLPSWKLSSGWTKWPFAP